MYDRLIIHHHLLASINHAGLNLRPFSLMCHVIQPIFMLLANGLRITILTFVTMIMAHTITHTRCLATFKIITIEVRIYTRLYTLVILTIRRLLHTHHLWCQLTDTTKKFSHHRQRHRLIRHSHHIHLCERIAFILRYHIERHIDAISFLLLFSHT